MSKLKSAARSGRRSGLQSRDQTTRKRTKLRLEPDAPPQSSSYHSFADAAELGLFRSALLRWYDASRRELPWRTLAATEKDANVRTYAVWVSEVMLQQTQVATVINYYHRWMKKWPTVQGLAAASLEVRESSSVSCMNPDSVEEVKQMWSGLGYYSRGRRLHEGAQKVMHELGGKMPTSAEDLLKQLPGVGRYTAGAIGSIALGQVTGVVDGNVTRVLCRVRAVGADSTSSHVTDALWKLAEVLVDPERPGDFNQAVMELGATLCTPKSPQCSKCPVQSHCRAYAKVRTRRESNSGRLGLDPSRNLCLPDIENCYGCNLCLSESWDPELGVQNFPRKPLKKAPRVERTLVCVLRRRCGDGETRYLLTQRPDKGLLAGMWELPSLLLEERESETKHRDLLSSELQNILGSSPDPESFQYVGEVVHVFSHIHQTYVVYSASVPESPDREREQNVCWLSQAALQEAAVSTGVKKIMKLHESTSKKNTKDKNLKRTKQSRKPAATGDLKQLTLSRFFTASQPTTS